MRVLLDHVTKRFADNFTAVDDFCAELRDGELVCLLGPSGCGKSTLLNMLSGILPLTEGHIWFDQDDVTNVPPEKRGVGLVFQNYALYPHMTVLANICFPLEAQHVPKEERVARAKEVAKLVHVDMLLDRRPGELSGGQQQRVAIARALIKNPRLLLLDEPLSNLDARLRLEMREEIRRIQQRTGVTAVFVTHDQEEALAISDRIILMKAGVMQQNDLPQNLYDDPKNQFVANFLGNPPINNIPGIIKDGVFLAEGARESVALPFLPKTNGERRVNLSIRAEAFLADDAGPIPADVVRVYTMGKEEMACLMLGNTEFRAYIDNEVGLSEGQKIHLSLRRRGVFVFDLESGERLA
ncbi:MAG: ABC transporter ATP-binding protein [Clostridiales bacterium]|nr:ABC transporter ATP-binding protein [Clostridiales bacterium]